MKFKTIVALMAVSVVLAGCANTQQTNVTPEEVVQETTGMANPWTESDYDGVMKKLGYDMKAPAGSKDISYFVNESESMAELRFTDGTGIKYTYRMKPTAKFEDISGLNYKWDVADDQKVDRCEGKTMRAKSNGETIDLILWYDAVPGVMYSLSATGPDLDGFDIVAVAESVFVPTQGDVG